jgi:ATP-binding cassette subfamily F protein 3
MLTLASVSKSYGTRTLFEDVSVFIKRTDRLGLVGPNGAGKSTLFNVILGEEPTDSGTITWERGADFGYLPQETAPAGDETILDLATAITPEFVKLRDRVRELEQGNTPEGPEDHEVHHRFDELGGYGMETKAKIILSGLGFRETDFGKMAKTFSGGWVMRAHLGRLLVREPALLLLDEPTNHLDLEALLWFQEYLTRYPGGLLVISHDRAFLNALCTGILELRSQTLFRWTGNYDEYLVQKEEHKEQQAAAFKNQQREIAHLQKFVDRFGAKASMASRAKSKEKQIERLKDVAVDEPEDDIRRISFRFPQPARSGLKVVTLTGVRQAYGDHVVYRHLDFQAERGERLVLVGPNGAGKSTLLKILAGNLPIQGGTRELGSNVTAGYFAQNRLDNLDARRTVMEEAMEMRNVNPAVTEQMARRILGGFLFRKDDVFKKVSVLSGGEKSRLALARLLLAPPNLLLMDEPTTHLDIASIDALVNALKQYEGTLIFISHDVHFIRSVANKVLHVASGRLTPYAGNYDYYLDKSKASNAREALTARFTDERPPETARPAASAASSGSNGKVAPTHPSTNGTSSTAGGANGAASVGAGVGIGAGSPASAGAAGSRLGGGPSAPAPVRSGPKTKEQKRAEAEARAARSAPLRALKAKVTALEKEIAELEARQAELTAALEAPETYTEHGRAQTLNRELSTTVDRIRGATTNWERASGELARMEA